MQGAAKGQRRYRYYVSKSLVISDSENPQQGWRVAAPEIERKVTTAAQAVPGDRAAITLALEQSGIDLNRLPSAMTTTQVWEAIATGR
ncbi:MAG: hypothetical protein IVW54_02215 [Candidatus Binataceae bacterium]|nr:hypothetical protein [Candidatus Binataceae bacterium]